MEGSWVITNSKLCFQVKVSKIHTNSFSIIPQDSNSDSLPEHVGLEPQSGSWWRGRSQPPSSRLSTPHSHYWRPDPPWDGLDWRPPYHTDPPVYPDYAHWWGQRQNWEVHRSPCCPCSKDFWLNIFDFNKIFFGSNCHAQRAWVECRTWGSQLGLDLIDLAWPLLRGRDQSCSVSSPESVHQRCSSYRL